LRKYLVALLAIPILATIYASTALQRSAIARVSVALGLGAFLGIGVMALARPETTTASLPTEIVPLTQAAFTTTIATDLAIDAPITIGFSTPMSTESVGASISVEPATAVTLAWDATDTKLTIRPASHWSPGTYHTVTIDAGALAQTGRPLTTPARSVFLTRAPAAVVLTADTAIGTKVGVDTGFTIVFDRPVDESTLDGAIRLEPAVSGELSMPTSTSGQVVYTFTPSKPLKADRTYRLVVEGARDRDGLAIGTAALQFRTTAAPAVVRFRPRDDTKAVARDAAISVRFTRAMDHKTTKAAFKVTADGKAVTGKVTWAEKSHVLVFVPGAKLPYDAKIVATVATSATSTDGVGLEKKGTATFTTVKKPKATSRGSGSSSGGSTGSGSWTAVERYYLGLMNCTRTGGWVTSTGKCSSPGGRDAAPLKLSSGISSKVSRPYAKYLATHGQCSHFIGGNPGDRLRRAGYTSYRWAENLGCRSGNPYSAVLASHRYFQSEKSYLGGHYVNLMNRKYDRAGIGVWVSHSRVRLVIDFYHP
jgi:uncharacterized protein YkwD